MYKIYFTKQSLKDKESLKKAGLDKKAKALIDILRENPFQTPPKYEKLVGNLTGAYSRRINIQHRLVYEIIQEPLIVDGCHYEGSVKILCMWTHYE